MGLLTAESGATPYPLPQTEREIEHWFSQCRTGLGPISANLARRFKPPSPLAGEGEGEGSRRIPSGHTAIPPKQLHQDIRIMIRIAALLAALIAASPALAHPGHGGGLAAGFAHPTTGMDHVLAMVAVGLWAALRGRGATFAWPASFVAAMAAGFGLTQAGLVVPQVETMVLASVVLLGAAVALRLEAPVWLGAAAIAVFGLAHGAAHGLEVQVRPLPYAAGFLTASLMLHAAGIGLAVTLGQAAQRWPVRLAGAGVALAGFALAANAI